MHWMRRLCTRLKGGSISRVLALMRCICGTSAMASRRVKYGVPSSRRTTDEVTKLHNSMTDIVGSTRRSSLRVGGAQRRPDGSQTSQARHPSTLARPRGRAPEARPSTPAGPRAFSTQMGSFRIQWCLHDRRSRPIPAWTARCFLTPSPAVVNRTATLAEPSGKGINVALALHSHGAGSAVLPIGGPAERWSNYLTRRAVPP